MLVVTELLFRLDKHTFVATNKSMLVVTNLLLRQNTNIIFSQQNFCPDKHTSVATKIMFVTAPANDTDQGQPWREMI